MNYVKVSNLFPPELMGNADYKGLDISQFIPGSQYYPAGQNIALLATKEEVIPDHPDITVITEQEYRDEIAYYESLKPPSPEQRITDLELALADIFANGGV